MDEGACLENRYGAIHRGFESHLLRLKNLKSYMLIVDEIPSLTLSWGGARVADWDRLLSGCRD